MVTLTAVSFTVLVHDTSILTATAEALADQAVDQINGCIGEDQLPNMAGTSGAKTLTVSSFEAGWIKAVWTELYIQYYKNAGASSNTQGLGGISESSSSSSGGANDNVQAVAEKAANALREIEVSRA